MDTRETHTDGKKDKRTSDVCTYYQEKVHKYNKKKHYRRVELTKPKDVPSRKKIVKKTEIGIIQISERKHH